MGLFDWLKGTKSQVRSEERIWLTRRAKFAGIQREIAQALGDPSGPDAVFVVAHFPDCLDELRSLVATAGFDEERVLVVLSEALEGHATAVSNSSHGLLIVVGERHPLPSHDDALRQFAQDFSPQCRFVQHVSLEDPLLRMFVGEWVDNVLRQLGMDEEEPIESQMVARRIRSAQEKIEHRASGNAAASSAQDWLEQNCPNL